MEDSYGIYLNFSSYKPSAQLSFPSSRKLRFSPTTRWITANPFKEEQILKSNRCEQQRSHLNPLSNIKEVNKKFSPSLVNPIETISMRLAISDSKNSGDLIHHKEEYSKRDIYRMEDGLIKVIKERSSERHLNNLSTRNRNEHANSLRCSEKLENIKISNNDGAKSLKRRPNQEIRAFSPLKKQHLIKQKPNTDISLIFDSDVEEEYILDYRDYEELFGKRIVSNREPRSVGQSNFLTESLMHKCNMTPRVSMNKLGTSNELSLKKENQFNFTTKIEYDHQKSFLMKKKYKCKYCEKSFEKSTQLGGHVAKKHKEEVQQVKELRKTTDNPEKMRKNYLKSFINKQSTGSPDIYFSLDENPLVK